MAPRKRAASQSPAKKTAKNSLGHSRSNSVSPAFRSALRCIACRAPFDHQQSQLNVHSAAPYLVPSNGFEDEAIAMPQPLAAESTQASVYYNAPSAPIVTYPETEDDDFIDPPSDDEEFNDMEQAQVQVQPDPQPSTSHGTAVVTVRGLPNEIRISAGPYSSRSLVIRFITVIDSEYAPNAIHQGYRFPALEASSSYTVHHYPQQDMGNETGNNYAPVYSASQFVDFSMEGGHQYNDFGGDLPSQDFWNPTGIDHNYGYWQEEPIQPQMGDSQPMASSSGGNCPFAAYGGGAGSDEIPCDCMYHSGDNYL